MYINKSPTLHLLVPEVELREGLAADIVGLSAVIALFPART